MVSFVQTDDVNNCDSSYGYGTRNKTRLGNLTEASQEVTWRSERPVPFILYYMALQGRLKYLLKLSQTQQAGAKQASKPIPAPSRVIPVPTLSHTERGSCFKSTLRKDSLSLGSRTTQTLLPLSEEETPETSGRPGLRVV